MLDWQTTQFLLPNAWHPCPSCVVFFLLLLYWRGVPLFYMHLTHSKSTFTLFLSVFSTILHACLSHPAFFSRCSHNQKPSSTATVVASIYILFFSFHDISKNCLSCHLHFYILHSYLTELINSCWAYYIFETTSISCTDISPCHSNLGFIFFILIALEGPFDTAEHTGPPWKNLTPGFLETSPLGFSSYLLATPLHPPLSFILFYPILKQEQMSKLCLRCYYVQIPCFISSILMPLIILRIPKYIY